MESNFIHISLCFFSFLIGEKNGKSYYSSFLPFPRYFSIFLRTHFPRNIREIRLEREIYYLILIIVWLKEKIWILNISLFPLSPRYFSIFHRTHMRLSWKNSTYQNRYFTPVDKIYEVFECYTAMTRIINIIIIYKY
mgnify:CR=1 FL=1